MSTIEGVLTKFGKYGGVAAGAAIVDWICFVGMQSLGASHLPSQMVSRVAGGLFAFLSHRHWSFRASLSGSLTTQGRRFLLLYVASYVVSIASLYLLADVLGVPTYVAKLIADATCFVFNFAVMNFYVFRSWSGLLGLLGRAGLARRS